MTHGDLVKTVIATLLTIVGFLFSFQLQKLNASVTSIQTDLMSVRIQMAELNSKFVTEERIREICQDEIRKDKLK